MFHENDVSTFTRRRVEYEDYSAQFIQSLPDYSKQFAHVYAARLDELRNELIKNVLTRCSDIPIRKLSELMNHPGEKCVIIGTLFKHQHWKPSILRELSEDDQLALQTPRFKYCSDKDQSYLEDETLRIKLVGKHVNIQTIVTGVVCGVSWYEKTDGDFLVEDWYFPGCVPQVSPKISNLKGKLILLSGLDFAKNSDTLALSLLKEWICGMVGDEKSQEEEASITRVIIAGNSFKSSAEVYTGRGHSQGKAHEAAIVKEYLTSMQKMDDFLVTLSQCCCITLMPGSHDPTNVMIPQKPFHPCLLPLSSKFESFKSAGNPWFGKVGDYIVLGTSGQPIEDIMKVSGVTDISPLTWLENTLIWRHMCPTAPDTLPSYPYYEKDLFIIKECPNIYFTGNMTKFETKLWKGPDDQIVRLICIPKFSTSHQAILVDLESLDTRYISFGASS